MKRTYRRDGRQSYMILEGTPDQVGFEKRMLQENEVHGLLSFSSVWQNDQLQLWYDITGRKSLRDYLEQESALTFAFLKRLLSQLTTLSEECCRYLLNPSHICMNPDTVYINGRNDSFTVQLCYCPLEMTTNGNGLLAVMEYLISIVDHKDEELCRVCYALYDAASEDCCDIKRLNDIVDASTTAEEETGILQEQDNFNAYTSRESSQAMEIEEDTEEEPMERMPRSRRTISTTSVASRSHRTNFVTRIARRIRHFLARRAKKETVRIKEKKRQLFPERQEPRPMLVFDLDDEVEDAGTMLLKEPSVSENRSDDIEVRGMLRYEGTENLRDIILNQPIITVGSASDNTAVLKVPSVSRHHAKIYRGRDGIYLEDLNSLNGTRIENKYLAAHEKCRLEHGKRIFFAAEPFMVV